MSDNIDFKPEPPPYALIEAKKVLNSQSESELKSNLEDLSKKKFFKNDYIYDCEVYDNVFTATFISSDYSHKLVFEISDRKDNRLLLFAFLDQLRSIGARMIGFNNLGFDYPLIHFLLKKRKATNKQIYNEAQSIIDSMKTSRFGKTIPKRFHYVIQVDLYKINHFDNKAKATSLKQIEFNMKLKNVKDLPFKIGSTLNSNQIDQLIEYNINDVLATLYFYHECYDALKLREELSEEYRIDFTNFNDTKIGSEIFIHEIEKVKPNSCFKHVNGKRIMCQTKRSIIRFNDIILPYVSVKRPEFQAVLDWFKKQAIKETKGVFSDLTEYQLGDVARHAVMVKKKSKKMDKEPTEQELNYARRDNPFIEVEVTELKSGKKSYYFTWNEAKSLNVKVNEHHYVFGVGGIHSSIESQAVFADEKYMIVDLDVVSYYSHLSIQNSVYPAHLGIEFCHVYNELFERRKSYDKKDPRNAATKLALNGTYGKSSDQFSPMFDPKYTMTITVNGQLSLVMLIERLLELKECSSIQSNTDGITMKILRKDSDRLNRIVKEWEESTKLTMERNDYKAMFIRDVNSYIAIYEDDKKQPKLKGAYAYELEHHKDQSFLVVQKAVEAFVTKKTPIEDFIKTHKSEHDFMGRIKVPKSSRLITIDELGKEHVEQNMTRYYVSNSSEARNMIKIMPPSEGKEDERRIGECVGRKVIVCNDIDLFQWNIDYDYYIEEANKLINFF